MKTYQYRSSLVLITWLFITASLASAGGTLRVFTDSTGCSIKGWLVGYNADKQTASILREDHKRYTISLDRFSNDDQAYIRERGHEKTFMHSVVIKPMREKVSPVNENYDERYNPDHIKSMRYKVVLKNLSCTRFDRVQIEYCLFYRQGECRHRRMIFSEGVHCGYLAVDTLSPWAVHLLETEPIVICSDDEKATVFGSSERVTGEILGIWIRIAAILPTGERITREIRSPGNISRSKEWTTTTVLAGLNAECAKKTTSPPVIALSYP